MEYVAIEIRSESFVPTKIEHLIKTVNKDLINLNMFIQGKIEKNDMKSGIFKLYFNVHDRNEIQYDIKIDQDVLNVIKSGNSERFTLRKIMLFSHSSSDEFISIEVLRYYGDIRVGYITMHISSLPSNMSGKQIVECSFQKTQNVDASWILVPTLNFYLYKIFYFPYFINRWLKSTNIRLDFTYSYVVDDVKDSSKYCLCFNRYSGFDNDFPFHTINDEVMYNLDISSDVLHTLVQLMNEDKSYVGIKIRDFVCYEDSQDPTEKYINLMIEKNSLFIGYIVIHISSRGYTKPHIDFKFQKTPGIPANYWQNRVHTEYKPAAILHVLDRLTAALQ